MASFTQLQPVVLCMLLLLINLVKAQSLGAAVGLGVGIIVAIVIGAIVGLVVVIVLCGCCCYHCCCKKPQVTHNTVVVSQVPQQPGTAGQQQTPAQPPSYDQQVA